ncbi:unnamed protein product [Meganyctiphanes norvegica]|uniref:Uncharacterized protein n=1 Tax=Meganyctiphanes norvegica TaxID=48144 RepID=A0AAV2RFU0_MEGNR
MPPNRSCPSLFFLCIKNITAEIIHMWKKVEINRLHGVADNTRKPRRQEFCIQIREHLSWGLNIFVQQDLLSYVLKKILNAKFAGVIDLSIENICENSIKLENAWDLLEDILFIFGREGISNVDLSHSEIKSSKCHGINICPIDIMGQACNRAIHNTIFKNNEWAKSLVSLNLQNAVDSRTVHCIGMSCQNLQFLCLLTNELIEEEMKDFVSSLSCLYGELPLDWIQTAQPIGCSNINYLVLPVFKRKVDLSEHITKMLFFMSNLRAIRNAPMRLAIRKYISRSTHVKPLKLVEFEDEESEHFPGAAQTQEMDNSLENVKITHVIQDVKSYTFSLKNESNNSNIHEIEQLTNIRRLELDLYVLEISWFPIFPLVTNFILKFEDAMDMGDILHINAKFPNLQHLSITASDLYSSLEDNRSDVIFYHLTSLQLHMLELDRLLLIQILTGCPKLNTLKIFVNGEYSSEFEPLTDEDISLIVPYLSNIETLEFSRDPFNPLINNCVEQLPITKASVETLLHNCSKLKWLGCLDSWDITEGEFKMLISQINQTNLDVHLSYYQRSPWQLLYPHKTVCPEWLKY